MNAQLVKRTEKQKKKIMEHHDLGSGIIGFIASLMVAVFVTIPHKIIGVIMDATQFINPSAREFILEISPFIGAFTGIIVIIMYLYKIKLYRRQIKEIDEKNKK